MTSWIRVPPKRQEEKSSLFFETSDAGFCTNFNQFLYAYAYSVSQGKPLAVYDLANPVSISYPLLKNTFADVSGVTYTDGMTTLTSSTRRLISRVMANANAIPVSTLREYAHKLFHWKQTMIPTLQNLVTAGNLPESFDLGVHMRMGDRVTTRDRRAITVDEYVRAAKKFQNDSKKDTLDIFLMSDSYTGITEFKKKADSSWTVYTLPSVLPNPEGHIQSQFNSSPARGRLPAYNTFMAELVVMQSISDIICKLSSNVGRFLYYTVEHPERIISLDEKFSVK
jgi:hypothetical protein